MKNNKNAFSLIIAMGLVLISSLLAFTILEFIVPFSKDIKGIENSTKSYYMANSGIEEGLYFFSNRSGALLRDETSKGYSGNYDYKYNTFSSGTTIPLTGKGNGFNSDYNTINVLNPIQLSIGYNFITNINAVSLEIKVPNFEIINRTLSGSTLPILNWQISSEDKSLNSTSGSVIKASQICSSVGACTPIDISTLSGKELDGTPRDIATFYNTNCTSLISKCILKFSILDDLQLDSGQFIPYLEWKVNAGNSIPLQYSIIESEGKSTGFVKKLNIKVPQDTVSEAFDFTVFQ